MSGTNGHAPQIIRAPLIQPEPPETNEEMFKKATDGFRRAVAAQGLQFTDPGSFLALLVLVEKVDALTAKIDAVLARGVHTASALPEFLRGDK